MIPTRRTKVKFMARFPPWAWHHNKTADVRYLSEVSSNFQTSLCVCVEQGQEVWSDVTGCSRSMVSHRSRSESCSYSSSCSWGGDGFLIHGSEEHAEMGERRDSGRTRNRGPRPLHERQLPQPQRGIPRWVWLIRFSPADLKSAGCFFFLKHCDLFCRLANTSETNRQAVEESKFSRQSSICGIIFDPTYSILQLQSLFNNGIIATLVVVHLRILCTDAIR